MLPQLAWLWILMDHSFTNGIFLAVFATARSQCCQGVDLNRNFDWHFGVEGSSTDPCSEIYQVHNFYDN